MFHTIVIPWIRVVSNCFITHYTHYICSRPYIITSLTFKLPVRDAECGVRTHGADGVVLPERAFLEEIEQGPTFSGASPSPREPRWRCLSPCQRLLRWKQSLHLSPVFNGAICHGDDGDGPRTPNRNISCAFTIRRKGRGATSEKPKFIVGGSVIGSVHKTHCASPIEFGAPLERAAAARKSCICVWPRRPAVPTRINGAFKNVFTWHKHRPQLFQYHLLVQTSPKFNATKEKKRNSFFSRKKVFLCLVNVMTFCNLTCFGCFWKLCRSLCWFTRECLSIIMVCCVLLCETFFPVAHFERFSRRPGGAACNWPKRVPWIGNYLGRMSRRVKSYFSRGRGPFPVSGRSSDKSSSIWHIQYTGIYSVYLILSRFFSSNDDRQWVRWALPHAERYRWKAVSSRFRAWNTKNCRSETCRKG